MAATDSQRPTRAFFAATHLGVLLAGAALHSWLAPGHPATHALDVAPRQTVDGALPSSSSHQLRESGTSDGPGVPVPFGAAGMGGDAGVPSCPAPAEVVDRSIPTLLHYIRESDHDLSPETTPERVANASSPYTDGWADAFLASEPNADTALAAALNDELCSSGHGPVENLLLLRLIGRISRSTPIVREGVDCVLAHADHEDVVLWSALDVWQRAGYGTSDALERIRANFRDLRTTARLQPLSDQVAQRDGTQVFEEDHATE